jgi:peptide/nickel transport system permease protein
MWAASLIVFVAIYAIGDPVRLILPIGTPQVDINHFRHQLGLDQPLPVQYINFLSRVVHGDLGQSLWLGQPAFQSVLERIPVTGTLVVSAIAIGTIMGVTLGVLASLRPGGWVDNSVNTLAYAFVSIAPFWLALMAILFFGVKLGWFATVGFQWDAYHLVLPILTLAIVPTGHVAQVTRSLMIAETGKQYLTTARAKGLSEVQIAIRHQLRNISLPIITLIFYDFARLFVGDALIVEVVFSIQGVGGLAAGALERGDIFLAQAAVIVAAVIVALATVTADLICMQMDPRTLEVVRPAAR